MFAHINNRRRDFTTNFNVFFIAKMNRLSQASMLIFYLESYWTVFAVLLRMFLYDVRQFYWVPLFDRPYNNFYSSSVIYLYQLFDSLSSKNHQVSSLFFHNFTFNLPNNEKTSFLMKNYAKWGINLAKAQSYQSDTFQINGKIINALIGKLNDNNIYLMHLQQGKQVDFEELKRHQSQNESQVGRQINEIQDRCSFLQHYSYAQEVTDILNGDLNKNPLKIKVYSSSQNDYIDQFLWNSPLSDVYNQIPPFHHQGPSLMQEQKFIHLEQPSLGPIIKQKQSNNIPLFPTVSSLENEVSELSKDYRKNLAGYIVKKVLRLLLSPTFSTRLARLCQRYSVDLAACRQYIQSTLPRVFGPNSIYELFTPRNFQQRGMKEMLVGLVEKTLRKRYTVEILREGRMKDYEAYIGVKNRGLLYFSQLLG